MSKLIAVLGAVALIIGLFLIGPILVIWALNTLFPVVNIDYTWQTWVAVIVIGAFISPNVKITRKS
jgi:hypothetical protein